MQSLLTINSPTLSDWCACLSLQLLWDAWIAPARHLMPTHTPLLLDDLQWWPLQHSQNVNLGFLAQTYIPWNMHELAPKQYKFDGDLNVFKFLDVIKEVGLHANLRPGPYICAEHDAGGLPWWLGSELVSLEMSTSYWQRCVPNESMKVAWRRIAGRDSFQWQVLKSLISSLTNVKDYLHPLMGAILKAFLESFLNFFTFKVEGGRTMRLRQNDKWFLHYATSWWDALLPQIKPYMHHEGGPILMVQVHHCCLHIAPQLWQNLCHNSSHQLPGPCRFFVIASLVPWTSCVTMAACRNLDFTCAYRVWSQTPHQIWTPISQVYSNHMVEATVLVSIIVNSDSLNISGIRSIGCLIVSRCGAILKLLSQCENLWHHADQHTSYMSVPRSWICCR